MLLDIKEWANMNIVYASDNNFAEMLGISMISLFENNRGCSEIVVYILDDGINVDNKTKLLSVAEKYNRKTFFIDVHHLLKSDMKQKRGSLSTFSRLYITQLISKEVDKVLYLDCDMIILHSLEELYNTNMDEFYSVGVNDCLSDAHLKLIGLNSDNCYFNAGVLLINLSLWNCDDITDKFEKFSECFQGNVPYADQGIINGVLSKKSKNVDLKYNCYTALYDFSYKDLMTFRKPSKYYSEAEVNEAKAHPAIVHFTTSFLSIRPWVEGCRHPYVGEWLKYKAMSPWADVPLRRDDRSGKKKLAVKIYRALPNGLAVGIAGALHAWIVPMMRRKK